MGRAPFDSVAYRRALESVRAGLGAAAQEAAIRGEGIGQFLWATTQDHFVEVCISGANKVNVVCWRKDGNVEREFDFKSYGEAALAARQRLAG